MMAVGLSTVVGAFLVNKDFHTRNVKAQSRTKVYLFYVSPSDDLRTNLQVLHVWISGFARQTCARTLLN